MTHAPVPPAVRTVAIAGGGQLAQMMIPAAHALGLRVVVLDRDPAAPAAPLADVFLCGDPDDPAALYRLAAQADALTFDLEAAHVPAASALAAAGTRVVPGPEVLAIIQDKGRQRAHFAERGLPGPRFALCDDPTPDALAEFGYPLVQKARRGGYDGRGVALLRGPQDLDRRLPVPSLLEARVDIARELAVMVARTDAGEVAMYPVTELHMDPVRHCLDALTVPAELPPALTAAAQDLAWRAVAALDGVGIFGVELFLTPDGALLLNEVAPRPHNSGHYTIEASPTDQFSQHLRAVAGLPLGPTEPTRAAALVNLLGGPTAGPAALGDRAAAEAIPGVSVHWYGKAQSRPGRKLGHLTAVADDPQTALARARAAAAALGV